MTRNSALAPVEKTVSSAATVTVTCDECHRRRSVGLSAPATLSDEQPDGLVESICRACGVTTVVGFRYTDDR